MQAELLNTNSDYRNPQEYTFLIRNGEKLT